MSTMACDDAEDPCWTCGGDWNECQHDPASPTRIIAAAVMEAGNRTIRNGLYDHEATAIAAHVVSKLTDAGYSIVQLPQPEATHTLMSGQSYKTFPVWVSDTPVFAFSDGDVTLDDVGDMTIDDARELGLALLAAAAAAEGEKP